MRRAFILLTLLSTGSAAPLLAQSPSTGDGRPRARDLGIRPGVYDPGPLNAITDVAGVQVGQVTLLEGESVRTGVTAIVPHPGNLFREKVPAGVFVYNAFGKLVGSTQVNEFGQLETPILLTNTLSVWDAAAALVDWELAQPGNEAVRSINPVVGETNDGWLNHIRGRHVKAADVLRALANARGGPVEEGSVGAGTGTVAFGWKGGIGTSSRRLAARAILGMARAGSTGSNGSRDFVIAFSTANGIAATSQTNAAVTRICGDELSPLFEAVAEATEEAIDNSLLRATTIHGRDGHTAEAFPIDRLQELLAHTG
jgi:L-aminopeptidase/D-esterase-like protein